MPVSGRNKILITFLVLVIIVLRVIPFFDPQPWESTGNETPLFLDLFHSVLVHPVSNYIASAILVLLTGLFAGFVFNQLWVFEQRTIIIPVNLALLFSAGSSFQVFTPAMLTPIVVISSILILFGSEVFAVKPTKAYNLALVVTASSLLHPDLIYLLPLFLAMLVYLRHISLKLFTAILLGVATVYWILFAILFISDDAALFSSFFEPVHITILNFRTLPQGFFIFIPGLTVLALFAFFSFIPEYPKMKQNHRIIFLSSNVLALYALGLALLGIIDFYSALFMALTSFAMIFGFLFQHSKPRLNWIFFILLVTFILTSFIQKF